jgi:drug/metabolite transporter (DMT)-like permease
MTSAASRSFLGYVLLVVTAIGWAGAWLTARAAAHDAPPLTVTWGRFVVAGIALVPPWLVLERGRRPRLDLRDWTTLAGMSLTGIAGYTVLFMMGVARAPASDGAIITPGLAGLFAMVIAFVFGGARPGRRQLAGAALALAGTCLVGWSAARGAHGDSQRISGDLLFVASAALWGGYTVLGKRISGRVPAVTGIFLASALGVAVLTPVVLAADGVPDPTAWSRAAIGNVLYLGLGATAVSFVTYYLAVELVGIGRAAPSLGLVPLFGVVGAALLLGERLTPLHAAGGLLVIAGIVVAARGRSSQMRLPSRK